MADIEVLQVGRELEEAVKLYREHKPRRILEIGCWEGGTLREWLRYAQAGATVAAVDLEHKNAVSYRQWQKPDTVLFTHTGRSQDPDAIEFMSQLGPYDWAFIDGDHGTWGAGADVQNVEPLMAPGGLMLLHDITPPAGEPSYPPLDLFRQFQSRGFKTWAYQYDEPRPWSSGIGVIQFP